MEDRRNVGRNSNSGDGTDQTGPALDVYDDDNDIDIFINCNWVVLYLEIRTQDEVTV